jgi:hypothetical protein
LIIWFTVSDKLSILVLGKHFWSKDIILFKTDTILLIVVDNNTTPMLAAPTEAKMEEVLGFHH